MILPDSAGSAGDLLLREWQPEDARALAAAIAASHDHLAPWMEFANQPPRSLSEHVVRFHEWEQRRRSGGDAIYGIFLATAAGDALVVGSSGLHRRIGPAGLEIGYWVHAEHTRRGIASATAALLTETAFGDPAIRHVEIHHDVANVASGAVASKLGFELVGDSIRPTVAPGEAGIEWRWRMTREAWFRDLPDAASG